jgi:hypothetical protein
MNDEPHTEPLTVGHGRHDYSTAATFNEPTPLRRMISAIPPKVEEAPPDADAEIAALAIIAANRHSEARRDAVLAVALAIARRGQNPVSDWTTRDTDTAYAIADQLIALGQTT